MGGGTIPNPFDFAQGSTSLEAATLCLNCPSIHILFDTAVDMLGIPICKGKSSGGKKAEFPVEQRGVFAGFAARYGLVVEFHHRDDILCGRGDQQFISADGLFHC